VSGKSVPLPPRPNKPDAPGKEERNGAAYGPTERGGRENFIGCASKSKQKGGIKCNKKKG